MVNEATYDICLRTRKAWTPVDVTLNHLVRFQNRPSESDSSSLTPMGPGFNDGIRPSSSSPASCDIKPDRNGSRRPSLTFSRDSRRVQGSCLPAGSVVMRGRTNRRGIHGRTSEYQNGLCAVVLVPTYTWEPLLLTWVM